MFTPKRINERDEHLLSKTIEIQSEIIKMCQNDPELTEKMAKMANLLKNYENNICHFADSIEIDLNLNFQKLDYQQILKYFKTPYHEYLEGNFNIILNSDLYLKSRLKSKQYQNLNIYSSKQELSQHFYELMKVKKLLPVIGDKVLLLDYYDLYHIAPIEYQNKKDYVIYMLAKEANLTTENFDNFINKIFYENNRFCQHVADSYYSAIKRLKKEKIIITARVYKNLSRLNNINTYPTYIKNLYTVYYYK
jgi:hypothetical protein